MDLSWWAVEERRNHDVRAGFAQAVNDQAKTMTIRGLAPRDWRLIIENVTARAWAAEVDPPEEVLEPAAAAFMAELRREIHGY